MADPSRRAVLLALTGALAGAGVAGCARIPLTGPVGQGGVVGVGVDPGYRVDPVGPVPGASPEEVVRGFLVAGVGVDDDFATARSFLTRGRRADWRPSSRTAVHPPGQVELVVGGESAPGTVPVALSALLSGEVDPDGHYLAASVGQRLDVVLTLVEEDGEWRISDAPDLLLLDESRFARTFGLRSVWFVATTHGELVPDPRWLLARTSTATTLVEQLLMGPPGWLAPAVTSGAPSGVDLPAGSVVVGAGVVSVDLPSSLQRASSESLRQLQQQLVATLGGLGSGVSQVEVTLDGGELPPPGFPVGDGSTPDGALLVVADSQVQRVAGDRLVPVDGLPPLSAPRSPALRDDRLAVLLAERTQLQLVSLGGASPVALLPLALGADLTPPSVDARGWTWSSPAVCDGTVFAVSPSGVPTAVPAAWLAGRRLVGVRAAGDGARLLVTSTGQAGQPDAVRVDLAAVNRAADGAPLTLTTDATPPTPWLASALAAVWLGGASVAVLGTAVEGSAQALSASAAASELRAASAPAVWILDGGRASDLGGPPVEARAVTLAGGSDRQALVVGGADGRLWPREGSTWRELQGVVASDPARPG